MNTDSSITKILIIKLGLSETLRPSVEYYPSLGDIIRMTSILPAIKEKYPDSHVSWLVAPEGIPLLKDNPYIDRILPWDQFVPFQLMREQFDVLVNLEKVNGVCALADMIDAWARYGYRFDAKAGEYKSYEQGQNMIDYMQNAQGITMVSQACWQEVLVQMLGVEWKAQPYILGYQPKSDVTFDVGLNFRVGSKWPTKAMSLDRWQQLDSKLKDSGFSVSWQEGKSDLEKYMDWIYSCRVLITQDSLGMHLGLAMQKKVVTLFGPTSASEMFMYNGGKVVTPRYECDMMPCVLPECPKGKTCMDTIDLDEIVDHVQTFLPDMTARKGKTAVQQTA